MLLGGEKILDFLGHQIIKVSHIGVHISLKESVLGR
jgi:hypothetical protein